MNKCKNCIHNAKRLQLLKDKIYGLPNECIQCRKVEVLTIDTVNVIDCKFLDKALNCRKFGKCKGKFCDYKRLIVDTEPRNELINRIALLSNQNFILNEKLNEYEKAGGVLDEGEAWCALAKSYRGTLKGLKCGIEYAIKESKIPCQAYYAILEIIKEALDE